MERNISHVLKEVKYTWSDLCFILNFRGQRASAKLSIQALNEQVGVVQPEERAALNAYKEPDEEFIDKIRREGWFKKTYETVRSIINSYMSSLSDASSDNSDGYGNNMGAMARSRNYTLPSKVVYTQKVVPGLSIQTKIVRVLKFYSLKGYDIPLKHTEPSDEQKLVLNARTGVTVVNSGPGTGKTETGVHKAAMLSDEGVFVLSYTNAAVDNFRMRLPNVVDDISKVSSGHGTSIWVTTIDSVASLIIPKSQKGVNFKMIVESAIRDIDQFGHVFKKADGTPLYKHMIIDEGQNLSKKRYDFCECLYDRWGFESCTILGDPRQRVNINTGDVYQQMLVNGSTELDEDRESTFKKPYVVNYKKTYRFENEHLLNLANVLSAKRPEIHVPLEYAGLHTLNEKMRKFQKVEEIAADIIEKVEKGTKPSSIFIVSPVIHKGPNRATIDRIVAYLNSGRNLKQEEKEQMADQNKTQVMSSSSLQENSVYISSIQSIVGLECDHLYFIGASGYPTYMKKEYEDINEGFSMNFVANTRARKSITYLVDDSLSPPDDIPDDMTVGGDAKETTFTVEEYLVGIRTSDISLGNYTKFFNSNIMSVNREEVSRFVVSNRLGTSKFSLSDAMYEIISSVLSSTEGRSVLMGSLSVGNPAIVASKIISGEIYDLMYTEGGTLAGDISQGKIMISDKNTPDIKTLREEYDPGDTSMHKLFKKVMTGKDSTLSSMDQINDIVMKLIGLICGGDKDEAMSDEEFCVEQVVFKGRISASGICSGKALVVFTENMYLAALIAKRIFDPRRKQEGFKVYQVGLESGIIWSVPCPETPVYQLRYMVNALFTIYCHVRLTRTRGNYSLSNVNRDKPWYFIDTEFCTRDFRKSGAIYDIALINGYDPFSSLCTLVQMEPSAYIRAKELHAIRGIPSLPFSYEEIASAPTAKTVYDFFCGLSSGKDPLIWYFNAKADISIFYERHPFYKNAWKNMSSEKIDWIFNPDFIQEQYNKENDKNKLGPYDFRFKDAMRVRADGKLTERTNADEKGSLAVRYTRLLGKDPNEYPHILLHTAASDALLLMEYVLTRELGNKQETE
jgi:hypothetical protein